MRTGTAWLVLLSLVAVPSCKQEPEDPAPAKRASVPTPADNNADGAGTCRTFCDEYMDCQVQARGLSYQEGMAVCRSDCVKLSEDQLACWLRKKTCPEISGALSGDACRDGSSLTRADKQKLLGAILKQSESGLPHRRTAPEVEAIAWMTDPSTDPYPEFTAKVESITDKFEQRALIRENWWRVEASRSGMNRVLYGRHLVAVLAKVKYDFDKKHWNVELTVDAALGSAAFDWHRFGEAGRRVHAIKMQEEDAEPIWPKLKKVTHIDVEFTQVPYRQVMFSEGNWILNDRVGLVPWAVRYCAGEPSTGTSPSSCSPWLAGPQLIDILGKGAYRADFKLAMKMDWRNPDCGVLSLCKVDGRCKSVGGACRATNASCKQSQVCAVEGQCIAREGRCVAEDGVDCVNVAAPCKSLCGRRDGKYGCRPQLCGSTPGRCVNMVYDARLGWYDSK